MNDIISQCVQSTGEGGSWDYSYDGDVENYYLQPYSVPVNG